MERDQKTALYRIIAAALLLLCAWHAPVSGVWKLFAFLVPYFLVGHKAILGALGNILHGEIFDEKFLMLAATVGAFCLGEYPEAVAVMLFFEVGEWFEHVAVRRSRQSVTALMDIRPAVAYALRGGDEIIIRPEDVAIGEEIAIRPGERIPLDGEIVSGVTTVDTAALTGESLPVERAAGDNVYSGSVNLTGAIRVRVTSTYENGTASHILRLAEEAAQKKAKTEGIITRFARVYTPCVVLGALLIAVLPPLAFCGERGVWLSRALVFLAASCPCALVVSVPLAFFCGIGRASRHGILIKGANDLERLARIDTVVFDKTGTLTKGCFRVTAVHPCDGHQAPLIAIAAAAERFSPHPIAESIRRAQGDAIRAERVTDVREIAGQGVEAVIDGKKTYVGNARLMDAFGVRFRACCLPGNVVHIAQEGEYLGHIVVSDEIKPDAANMIAEIKKIGVKRTVLLTGDSEATAENIRQQTGIDEAHGGLMPDGKVDAIEERLSLKSIVAFLGDGINDAPILSRVDVGIAMGALGSDAAIEAADVVLMDDRLMKFPLAMRIARKTVRIVRRNIGFALLMKALVLALGALGWTGMWAAVFADVGVLVLTVLHAVLAQRGKM